MDGDEPNFDTYLETCGSEKSFARPRDHFSVLDTRFKLSPSPASCWRLPPLHRRQYMSQIVRFPLLVLVLAVVTLWLSERLGPLPGREAIRKKPSTKILTLL